MVYSALRPNDKSRAEYTDLSATNNLTQEMLDAMKGDSGTILPDHLTRPAHWPEFEMPPEPAAPPDLPEKTRDPVLDEIDGQLQFRSTAPPVRDDLETIFKDLREDLTALKSSGSFNNISRGFDTVFNRFARLTDCNYQDLDQVRFGVQATSLRKRFDAQRYEIDQIAPDKTGDLDAILLSAELITGRLPGWQDFLKETQAQWEPIEANIEAVEEALKAAEDAMQADPAHYAASLTNNIAEYLDTKTMEAYLAAVSVLNDIAYVTFRALRNIVRDTASESRKLAVKGLARTVVFGIGSALAKLAGLVPVELEWVLPWLKYVPRLLG